MKLLILIALLALVANAAPAKKEPPKKKRSLSEMTPFEARIMRAAAIAERAQGAKAPKALMAAAKMIEEGTTAKMTKQDAVRATNIAREYVERPRRARGTF